MAQFPFAHQLEMTHMVRDGRLHVSVRITSQSDEPIAVAVGFHPYFTLPNTNRDDWAIEVPALTHLALNNDKIPTGERTVVSNGRLCLRGIHLDDVYTDLVRNGSSTRGDKSLLRKHWNPVGFGQKYCGRRSVRAGRPEFHLH